MNSNDINSKNIDYTPDNIEEIVTKQFVRFIDTTPTAQNPTWAVVGVGVEDDNANISYNPEVDRIKWIIDLNARTQHRSNDKQMGVTQSSYKGDPCFEFVEQARDTIGTKTHVLEIDTWNETQTGKYASKMSDATIVVDEYSGNQINWNLYFDGDPKEGTSTIADGVPTFTETV